MKNARREAAIADAPIAIESLDHEGRGVGHADGKVVFVEGALPGERVAYALTRNKASYAVGEVVDVLRASSARVVPRCPHFGVCGGCSMQHLDASAQVAVKQRVLEDNLLHIGRVRAERMLAPIRGAEWHYRHRARLSVRVVEKKGGALVGFHEKRSSYVADMRECHVLPADVSAMLVPMRALIERLSIARRVPQIEVAIGEGAGRDERRTILVFRHLEPFTGADEAALAAFGRDFGVSIWLQPKGPDTIHPLVAGDTQDLVYSIPEYGVRMAFRPTDFTQVNAGINRVLVHRAVCMLELTPDDRVADLFCGLGNFSLPIARTAREVVGIEGSKVLTDRAAANATAHGLGDRARFTVANLFEVDATFFAAQGRFDKVLIDPPRDGAIAVVKAFVELGGDAPRRIVYVSCNPSTLARDAAVLTTQAGYRLREAGIVNMFPQTSHVESIALFTRD